MRKTLKSTLAAVMLSSVALVPAATVAFVATTDAAIAKSDKSKGGGKSSSAKAKSKGSSKAKGKSGSKSAKSSGGSGGIEGLFRKITGQEKKQQRVAKAAPAQSAKPAKGSGFHPSELGNMNGAMNANINAVLAHIRNGNTNGPIGGMALLAVAGANADGAEETVELAGKFAEFDMLLIDNGYIDEEGNADYSAYQAALLGTPGNGEIEGIETAILNEDDDALAALLAENDFADLAAYEFYRDGEAGDPPITAIEDLATELDGLEAPDEEAVAEAEENLQAKTDAELAMLELWNKNGDTSEEITEEEQALLDELYKRFEGNEGAIATAIGEPAADDEMDDGLDDEVADCEDPEVCEEDEDLAALVE